MSLRAQITGLMSSAALGGAADTYAVEGFSPPVVADFENEYYRAGGSDTTFSSMFTFARASTATYVDSSGTIQTASSGTARIGNHVWNGSAWVNKGLLIETQARTNLLLNSGTLSTQNVTTSATPYTLSFTGTGTVTLSGTSTAGPLVGTGTGENNRVNLTFTPTAGTLTLTVSGTVTNAQLESARTPSSYIPTAGATVTRAAETLAIAAANMSYSATAMSFHMKGTMTGISSPSITADQRIAFAWVNNASNYLRVWITNSIANCRFESVASSVSDDVNALEYSGINTSYNLATRITSNAMNLAREGTAQTENTTLSAIPDVSAEILRFHSDSFGRSMLGNITLFRQWDDDITDTGIEAAST